jgi:DNA-directed RNA polymerase subunit M/transcription elongation factor TFIIS
MAKFVCKKCGIEENSVRDMQNRSGDCGYKNHDVMLASVHGYVCKKCGIEENSVRDLQNRSGDCGYNNHDIIANG